MADTLSSLRVVIFAGGVGTRMWPLSRKATPKQFEKIIDNKSTLQLAVERIRPEVPFTNIYISTGNQYVGIIKEQLPEVPPQNIIGEPEMRDVAAAVGYLMAILAKTDPAGPVAILWSDHLLSNVASFKEALQAGADYINQHKEGFVFLGQKPRFANQNLGWIQHGEKISQVGNFAVHEFISWHYRPELPTAQKYFASADYTWNPGYFIVAPQYALDQFARFTPKMAESLRKLQASYGMPSHKADVESIYPALDKVSFDDAILAKIDPNQAVVLPVDLGWSDIGTWEALKEALVAKKTDNLTKGKVVAYQTEDSVVYNYTDQLVTTINVKDLVVVVTPEVVMVVPQASIPEVKKMLATFTGTENEKYT